MGMTMAEVGENLLVCAPQWTYQCKKANLPLRMVGNCYVLNAQGFEYREPETLDSPYVRDCPGELDVILLLDGSGSIGARDFYIALAWVKDFLKSYREGLNNGEVHVGLIQYSGYTEESSCDMGNLTRKLKVEMPLGSYNLSEATDIISRVVSLGDCTLTGDAINVTSEHFISRGRQNNVAVMIVVTDGVSSDSVSEAANHARANGITVIAVGVGNKVDIKELDEIADSNQYRFNVSEYESLSGILGELQEAIIAAEGSFLERISSNSTAQLSQDILGMSAVITKQDSMIYSGAIGAISGMGSVISRNGSNLSDSQTLTKDALLSLIRRSIADYTAEDNYLGYSMASGFIFGSKQEYIAVGMPRFLGYGGVLLFPVGITEDDIKTAIHTTVVTSTSPQIGSYFGFTVTSMDVNNDGFDDLLVGAPLYSYLRVGSFDEGSVTIFFGEANFIPSLNQNCMLVGFDSNSRFGSDITAAGDLDRDGFQDFVVGAPVYNNKQGEVVLYYGNANCPSRYQRIAGKTSASEFPYFGYSIAVQRSQPESVLLVSSPNVGSLSIFRSRPVIDVTATMDIGGGRSQELSVMDVVECIQRQSIGKSCITLNVCFKLSWRDSRQSTGDGRIELSYEVTLESDLKKRRFMFVSNKEQLLKANVMVGSQKICVIQELILRVGILPRMNLVDFSTPAIISLLTKISSHVDHVTMSPVLPQPQIKMQKVINFTKGCRTLNSCSYDLMLTSSKSPEDPLYLNKADEIITITLVLINLEDPTFFTKLIIASETGSITKLESNCSFLDDDRKTLSYRHAIFGSVMLQNTKCEMDIFITLRHFSKFANDTEFDITIRAVSLVNGDVETADITPENNVIKLKRNIKYATSFDIKGVSEPFDVQYWRNISTHGAVEPLMDDDVAAGGNIDVLHKYEVVNTGVFTTYDTNLQFTWPAFVSSETKMPILCLYEFSCLPKSICTCNLQDISNSINGMGLAYDSFMTHGSCQPLLNETKNISTTEYESAPFHYFSNNKIGCDGKNKSIICTDIKCNVTRLPPQQSVTIKANMKLWIPTFKLPKEKPLVHLESTFLLNQTNGLNFPDVIYKETVLTSTHQYFTVAVPEPVKPLNTVLILIAMVVGLVIVTVLILICWKCGFFKSKYKLELERRKAMVLTEEELELENTLSKRIKSEKQCMRSTLSSSKSSHSDSDMASFMVTSYASKYSSAEESDGVNELYLEMTPLRKYETEPWARRRAEIFDEGEAGNNSNDGHTSKPGKKHSAQSLPCTSARAATNFSNERRPVSALTAPQADGAPTDNSHAYDSPQQDQPNATLSKEDRSESPDYSFIESTKQEDGKLRKKTVSLKR